MPHLQRCENVSQSYLVSATSPDVDKVRRIADDGSGHKTFEWSIDVRSYLPALADVDPLSITIDSVQCSKSSLSPDPRFYEVSPTGDQQGVTATCRGWFQNASKYVVLTAPISVHTTSCHDLPWRQALREERAETARF